MASNVGDMAYAVALPWYVLSSHGGVLLLGTVLAAYGVPRTVLLPLSGHASDRWGPWTLMMAADSVRALATLALVISAATQRPSPAVLIPIAVVLGAGEGLFLPGSFSIIPALLPAGELQAGNAISSSGTQIANLVGPALGGVLVAAAGPVLAFAVDTASFLLSAASLAGIRHQQQVEASAGAVTGPAPAADRPGPKPASVWTVLRTERVLQLIMLINCAANLALGGLDEVALPDLVDGPFHSGAAAYGALLAAFGAGALVGTIAAGQMRPSHRPALVGSFAFLVESVALVLVPVVMGVGGAAGAMVLVGAGNGFGNILTITAFQVWAPKELMGRLMGLLLVTSFGVFPISAAATALFVHRFGPELFFPVAAAVLAAALLMALSQHSWRDFPGVGDAPSEDAPATMAG